MVKNIFRRTLLLIFLGIGICYSALGMEENFSQESLISEIAEKLKTKELTFSNQIPGKLVELLNTAIDQQLREVLKSDKFVNPSQSSTELQGRILTATERLNYLDILQKKAESLYKEGKLTSYWLNFIVLNIADLLSLDGNRLSVSDKTGLRLHLNASTLEETFERFSYLNDHRSEYREKFVKEYYPCTGKKLPSSFPFGNFSLNEFDCYMFKWILCTDCFFFPVILENPFFPISLLNKAFAHRIVPVAVPLKNSDYDGFSDQSPYKFGEHDGFHGNLFEINNGSFLDILNVEFHPLQKLLYEAWNKLKATPKGEFAYFILFHENGFHIRKAYEKEGSMTLEKAIDVVRKRFKELYDHDLSTPEIYVRSCLKAIGIENPDFLGRTEFDSYGIVHTTRQFFGVEDFLSFPRLIGGFV